MDHLGLRIESSTHADLLPVEPFYFILMVNIVRLAAGSVLEHVLVALLYDGADKLVTIGRGRLLGLVGWLSGLSLSGRLSLGRSLILRGRRLSGRLLRVGRLLSLRHGAQ